jgi:hypothetical protein
MQTSASPTSEILHESVPRDDSPSVNRELLAIYLDDHHAGAVGGLELAKRAAANNPKGELGHFLAELVRDLENDQQALRQLMDELGVRWKTPKAAAGWLAEKAGRLKLNGRLVGYSPLSRVVELEGLLVGSRGRLSLLRTLKSVVSAERAETFNLAERAERAVAHTRALEHFRVAASEEAFLAG